MKKVKENVLAEGETTGHAHRVRVAVMEREDGVRVFKGETEVTHEEHKTINLPKRKWNSAIGNETDHIEKMDRQIRD